MIAEGLYVPTNLGKRGHIWHRYVLGELSGMVRYSRGGTRHFMCRSKTFEKWIERYEAQHKPNVGPGDVKYVPPEEMSEEVDDEAA
jgi:hypothetical protein